MYDDYNWKFDKDTIENFDSHVNSSVPLYKEFHNVAIEISKYFIRDNTKIVDIGCSTGVFLNSLKKEIDRNNEWLGIDVSTSMIEECKKRYYNDNIKFILSDGFDIDYTNTSLVTFILTLQFIPKHKREQLLQKIYNNIDVGTCIIIVEKIKSSNLEFNDIYNDLYYDFKESQGLTPDDILKKNRSLRGIMKPLTIDTNLSIFKKVGFSCEVNLKYCNFVMFTLVKDI